MTFRIASTVSEVVDALAAGARPIAGGSDLVVGARQRNGALPDDLVAIDRVPDLAVLEATSAGLRIGATVSHDRLASDPLVARAAAAIADGSALVGSPATRHVGTIGGNVMNASPANDTGAGLLVLGASATLESTAGRRTLALSQLWTGPGTTSATPSELLVELRVPEPAPRFGSAYLRLEYRRAMEIAVVGAAAAVRLSDDGMVGEVRLALTAVAPTVIEVPVELTAGGASGVAVSAAADSAAEAARDLARPITDLRASDRFRRHVVGVMARRAVRVAAQRASGAAVPVPASHNFDVMENS